MEKTYLRFVCVEVMERLARCDALLSSLLLRTSKENYHRQGIIQGLQERLSLLENKLLGERELLLGLLTDSVNQPSQDRQALFRLFGITYQALTQLTKVIVHLDDCKPQPEVHLFLKDALPEALHPKELLTSIAVGAEGNDDKVQLAKTFQALQMPHVQFSNLSVLQQENPLAWVGLSEPVFNRLAHDVLTATRVEKTLSTLLQRVKKETAKVLDEETLLTVLAHSIGLRVFGPAYYFHTISQALLSADIKLLVSAENALFYGLNHFNVAHNQTVILHESVERLMKDSGEKVSGLPETVMADWFKLVERIVPERFAFASKHLDRSIHLKERLAEGVLLSSAPVFPTAEIAQAIDKAVLDEVESDIDFPIYQLLSMTTEYPHTSREIVNAGWLHKVERGAIWVFAALQEQAVYQKLSALFSAQDHLLAKSIETAELHRVLLYTPEPSRI